ncbi:MAG: DUF2905 family protein [candidate division WOR-3 bacterium]
MGGIGKILILSGIFLIFFGIFFLIFEKFSFKMLPLDIYIKKNNFHFFFPIGTSIVISIILTIILNILFFLFFRK